MITNTAKSSSSKKIPCDMCQADNAGNKLFSIVPSPWLRLMGDEAAEATGCCFGLHLCFKCQTVLRAILSSERRYLRNQAAKFFAENDLLFPSTSNASRMKKFLMAATAKTSSTSVSSKMKMIMNLLLMKTTTIMIF